MMVADTDFDQEGPVEPELELDEVENEPEYCDECGEEIDDCTCDGDPDDEGEQDAADENDDGADNE